MNTVAAGVTQLRIQHFVNVYFVETGTPGEWVLIDTGLPGSASTIIAAADELFAPGSRPEAILLTHGHLDHVGAARELADHWRVPVIAHPLEIPYLTGKALFPPRDQCARADTSHNITAVTHPGRDGAGPCPAGSYPAGLRHVPAIRRPLACSLCPTPAPIVLTGGPEARK